MTPRLKLFYTQTLKDPLFAAEGLDLDNFSFALDELESVTLQLEGVWRASSFRYRLFCLRYPFTKSIFPFSFLRTFITCERARRELLVNPTEERAASLITHYRKALGALESDLNWYYEGHLGVQKLDGISSNTATYYFHNEMVTFTQILEQINVLKDNIQALKNEIKEREATLIGTNRDGRKAASLILDAIPQKNTGPELSKIQQEAIFLEETHHPALTVEKYGPIFYKTSHFDTKPTTHQFFVYIKKEHENERRHLHVVLADKHFFLKLDESELNKERPHWPLRRIISESFTDRGIPYLHQWATTPYATRDLTYWADLATIFDLKRRPFLNQSLVLNEKSSLLDLIIWKSLLHVRYYLWAARRQAKTGHLPSHAYMLVARSFPSLLYLTFNRSVWRLPKKISFLGSHFGAHSAYKTLEEIVPIVSKEMLEKIFEGPFLRLKDLEKFAD